MLQLIPALLMGQQSGGIDSLFPARPSGYLTDVANVVDPPSASRIDDLAARLRTATGAELAVVTLPAQGRYETSELALAIGRAWGVGAKAEIGDQRRNAGLVLLVVPKREGQKGGLYLATGRGIEGIVTDATAGRILDLMIPQLQDGEYGPALVTGTEAIASTVAKGFGVTDSALTAADPFKNSGGGEGGIPGWVIPVLFILVFFVLPMLARAGRGGGRRGPRGGPPIYWGPGWGGGGWGGGFGGGGFGGSGGGFGGFGGGGGFSGGGAGRSF
ncbi:MAG TPA: TPM domain-containing protein [Gemmatimonadales bacterium]|nr:TPM domain-containing protein [Gemmatimonadales bacterium]